MQRWCGIVAIAAASILCAATSEAQITCGPDTGVERVYVDLRFLTPTPLESNQLFGDFGDQSLIELVRQPDKAQWYVDSWSENPRPDLTNLTLTALRTTPGFRPRKLGWEFSLRGDPVSRPETLGGKGRCTASFVFIAVPVWRVRVVAEPKGAAPQVPITCGGVCDQDATTDFTTRWIDRDSISMSATFGKVCKVELPVKRADLPRIFDFEVLRRKLSDTPCGGLFGATRFRPNLPVGGISIQLVPPQ